MSNKKKKCEMCFGTGKVIVGSDKMGGLTGSRNTCPHCMGKGYY